MQEILKIFPITRIKGACHMVMLPLQQDYCCITLSFEE
jgi:hypothetical protein